MGFDSYNMGQAISQGNMLNDNVNRMNTQIAINNKVAEDKAVKDSKTAKTQEGTDKTAGVFKGIKDSIQETTATGNFKLAYDSYQKSIKPSSAGAGGFSEVAATQQDLQDKAKKMGANTQRDYSAESIAEESGDSELQKVAKGVGGAEGLEEEASLGGKVAGVVGKGVGIAGGLASSGLDLAADYESFKEGKGLIAGDNLADKISNIGTIGGTALDMIGLIPGFQLAGVLGTGIQALSGIAGAVGDAEDTADKVAADKKAETPATVTPDNTVFAQNTLAGSFAGGRTS